MSCWPSLHLAPHSVLVLWLEDPRLMWAERVPPPGLSGIKDPPGAVVSKLLQWLGTGEEGRQDGSTALPHIQPFPQAPLLSSALPGDEAEAESHYMTQEQGLVCPAPMLPWCSAW